MMQISPVHVAGVLLAGGLVTGTYFAYNVLAPSSLEDHLKSLGLELITSNWEQKEAKYKQASGDDLIQSIQQSTGSQVNSNFANQLQEWCEKKKVKNFVDENDLTYRRFSLWCTTNKAIKDVLQARNLKALDETKKQAKVLAYKALQSDQKFINKANKKAEEILKTDLDSWCQQEKEKDYKYEGDPDLKKLINWCYGN